MSQQPPLKLPSLDFESYTIPSIPMPSLNQQQTKNKINESIDHLRNAHNRNYNVHDVDDWGKKWKYLDLEKLKNYGRKGLVPQKSIGEYIKWYNGLMSFLNDKDKDQFTEDSVIDYFEHLKNEQGAAASSIYSMFSGIKCLVQVTMGIDCNKFYFAKRWLKQNAKGKEPKKAPTFEDGDMDKFIKLPDPNDEFLREKVAATYGKNGRFRAVDYTMQNYDKYDEEHKGYAKIKHFEKGLTYIHPFHHHYFHSLSKHLFYKYIYKTKLI